MIRFIITVFGNRYIGMLLTCIYSIQTSNPNAQISIFWEDMDEDKIFKIKTVFPKVSFQKTQFDPPKEQIKRIPSKINFQKYAISQEYPEEFICLVDVDTLAVKNISKLAEELLDHIEADIVFTNTGKAVEINAGVMLCKNNQKTKLFFEHWQKETEKIIKDNNLLKEAVDEKSIYGSADQMSLHKIIKYRREKSEYKISINDQEIKLASAPCEILNEIRSVPISEKTHIIHYKSEWQTILIDGGEFTKKRPWSDSKDMFLKYMESFIKASKLMGESDKTPGAESLNIKVPLYIDQSTGELKKYKKLSHDIIYGFKKTAYKIPGIPCLSKMIKSKI